MRSAFVRHVSIAFAKNASHRRGTIRTAVVSSRGGVGSAIRCPRDGISSRTFSSEPLPLSPLAEEVEERNENTIVRRFEDLDLHPKSLKALRRHGLHKLTEIQEKTFDVVVSGSDVVGRARTGTGKTLSFLLPSLERIVRNEPLSNSVGIQILILSPTRELAAQIAKEAERLVAQHGPNITSQVVFGGSSRREDIDRFNQGLPTILVATPGRLKDHLASTKLKDRRAFVEGLQNLQVLVLDETDRLLDMGFRRDIADIISCLPRRNRQTLLFSATLPENVREVVDLAVKPNYEMIDCIQDEDPTSHTNTNTDQSQVVLPADRFWTGTLEYLLDLVDQGDNKVMVFFPMTSMVQMYANVFNTRFGRRVWELHSKMHQRERTTISRRFRNAKKGVLFTSDVSARGVDYPNVTHVIQIGASESRETYIHRLGRTGRAGKKGSGLLILPEVEEDFLTELDGLELSHDTKLQAKLTGSRPSKKLMDELGPMAHDVKTGKEPKLEKAVHDAYQAMVAYYVQRCPKHKGREVVMTINRLIQDMGLRELPAIEMERARRIGIDSLPGLNIRTNWKDQSWTTGWGEAETRNRRFGKAYGDFDGQFERGDSPDDFHWERNAWKVPRKQARRKPNAAARRRGDGHRDRRSNKFNEAFTKVGWKREYDQEFKGKRSPSKRKGATFQRWESPGKFAGRS